MDCVDLWVPVGHHLLNTSTNHLNHSLQNTNMTNPIFQSIMYTNITYDGFTRYFLELYKQLFVHKTTVIHPACDSLRSLSREPADQEIPRLDFRERLLCRSDRILPSYWLLGQKTFEQRAEIKCEIFEGFNNCHVFTSEAVMKKFHGSKVPRPRMKKMIPTMQIL